MSSLLRHISRNLPPYQYKEALEEMYANLEEFDAICNSNFLPAFEQENDSNQSTNSEESTEKKSTDVTATSSSKTEVDLTNKNAANPKQKKDPIFKKDASFGEKLKAIAKALAEMIHKMVGWFADKIGKIDFADQEFLKRLDNAKGKGIQNVDITTYNYGIDTMRKCVTIMDQDFEKFDNTVNTIFEKYDEACNDGKTDPKDVSDTIKVDGLEMMNEECDFISFCNTRCPVVFMPLSFLFVSICKLRPSIISSAFIIIMLGHLQKLFSLQNLSSYLHF